MGQWTWAHQSFGEYLAACRLSKENLPPDKILEKILAPDGKIAREWYDTVRWLAEMRTDILYEVIQRQPMLILTPSVSLLNEEEFSELFNAILRLGDPHIFSYETWNLREFRAIHLSARHFLLTYLEVTNRYKRIRRLASRIVDRLGIQQFQKFFERTKQARRFAFRLMECFNVTDADKLLAELVNDRNEDLELRHRAARRILDVGSIEEKLELKQFIHGRDDDPEDELKGHALQALWPDQLTADELFCALSPLKRENFRGSHRTFLFEGGIVDKLQVAELPVALRWVAAQPSRHEMSFALNDFPEKIMRKAWGNICDPEVKEAFAETAVAMITRSDGLFGQSPHTYPPNKGLDEFAKAFVAATDLRHDLVLLSLPHLLQKERTADSLIRCWPPLVVADDLDWLLEHLDPDAQTGGVRWGQLAQLVASLLPRLGFQDKSLPERNRDIENVYYAGERYPELKQLTQQHFESIELFVSENLEEPAVIPEREHFHHRREIDKKIAQQRAEVRPFERLQEALDQMEAGVIWQWIYICAALTSIPSEMHTEWGLKSDLTDFPTWQSCDDEMQERIARAAKSYVMSQDVIPTDDNIEDWYETPSRPRIDDCAYLAIFLLQKVDVNALSQFPADCWKRWSKIIVWYPYATSFHDGRTDYHREIHGIQQDLMRRLNENASRAFLDNFRSFLVTRDPVTWQELSKVGHLWGSELERMLLDLLRDSDMSPSGRRSILDFLLARESAEALRIAEAQISSSYTNQNERDLVVEFAVILLIRETQFDRSPLWKLLQNDNALRHTIVDKLAEEDWYFGRFTKKATTPELIDLFIWFEERYPTREDPRQDGGFNFTTIDQFVYWRHCILTELSTEERTKSPEALAGIRRILKRFPRLTWLHRIRLELEKAVEGSEWKPASPRKVMQLISQSRESRKQRFGKLRQWCRDNPAEIAAAGVVITLLGLLWNISASGGQQGADSKDPHVPALTETSANLSTVSDITTTNVPGPDVVASPSIPASAPHNPHSSDTD